MSKMHETSIDDGHSHEVYDGINDAGFGYTGFSGKNIEARHNHGVRNWKVLPQNGHTHRIGDR